MGRNKTDNTVPPEDLETVEKALQKQAAFLITRKRNEEGDEGTHGFQKARDAVLPTYYERIKDALNEDIGKYLATFFYL